MTLGNFIIFDCECLLRLSPTFYRIILPDHQNNRFCFNFHLYQINSAASDMASLLQEHQLQSTSISKPPPHSTVLPSRNRRKAQVPRPNVKAETSNECEKRNSTSNNFIVQNLLAQNKTSSSDYRAANIESPSTSMSNPRWGNESITMTHGLAARTLAQMAEPLSLQNKGSYQFPMDISDSNVSRSTLKDTGLGRGDTSSPGGDYLPSMVINQSSVCTVIHHL